MQYYKDTTGQVHGVNDMQTPDPSWTLMTEAELTEWQQPSPQEIHDAKMAVTVSRAQGKIALMQAELWDDVVAAVDAIEDPTQKMVAQVALNEATEWKRGSPTMQMLSGKLDLTEAQEDALWDTAQAIEL